MFWDIALPVLAAVAQALTGYLGWRVAEDGVQPERKTLYEWMFIAATFVGIVSVGVAAYRGSQISGDLNDLKNGQNKVTVGLQDIDKKVSQPPKVVFPKVPEHTHVEFEGMIQTDRMFGLPDLQLKVGEAPTIRVAYRDVGEYGVNRPSDGVVLELVSKKNANDAFVRARRKVTFTAPGGTIASKYSAPVFHSWVGPAMTETDMEKFKARELAYCAFGAVQWFDATGHYETELARCLQIEPGYNNQMNWHNLKEDNEEHKLNY
jgi:hypothetical protein